MNKYFVYMELSQNDSCTSVADIFTQKQMDELLREKHIGEVKYKYKDVVWEVKHLYYVAVKEIF